jgi:hypothetical protein
MRANALLLLVAAAAAVGTPGCATSISARHTPFYRASPHSSTIAVSAVNNQSGIRQIRVNVTRGTMTDCTELGGAPSVIPCRTGAVTTGHICPFSGSPASATCNVNLALGNREMVSYTATVTPSSGSSRSTVEVTYAAGFPPAAFIARPVWWHRDQGRAGKIDLGFFPDADYSGDYLQFTNHLEPLIAGVFFNSGQEFAQTYTLFRETHNLWAGPFGADAEGCSRSFNAQVTPVSAAMDGRAIVHRNDFRDCASISLGGSGSVFATAGDADWILVHESGHFLHGQGDEYCCDGGYGTSGSCKNVFGSQSACESYASANGFPAAQCTRIVSGTTQTNAWRVDDAQLETMRDRTDNSNWRNTSNQCVVQRYVACGGGSCY